MKVSVSFLSKEYSQTELIKQINKTTTNYIHVDIMDGKFTDNKTNTFSEIKKLLLNTTIPLDVHLMVNNPLKYIEDYALLNTEYITFHYEVVKDIKKTIEYIKNFGIKAGISINPDTNVSLIFPYLKYLDLVLIMSVEPGKSGQEFKPSIIYKLEALKQKIIEDNLNTKISIDGGMNEETIPLIKDYTDIIVSASYLHSGNMQDKIKEIQTL
ncbi:MAG: ribulose-phosphate 3-epimerase [Bacilli bacterium]